MSASSGVDVVAIQRVPSIRKAVDAQRQGRAPSAGTICVYDTRTAFGAITVVVPRRETRSTRTYWSDRAAYFRSYPGSAETVPGVGLDAWLAGGAYLHVLIRERECFNVSTQMYQPQSRELLVRIATAILAKR
jgi:hypothetical protein